MGTVKRVEDVATVPPDDISEAADANVLKFDVQGAVLAVFERVARTPCACVAVHMEFEFLPLYEDQPLVGNVGPHA